MKRGTVSSVRLSLEWSRPLTWRHLAQLPQVRNEARVSGLWRVREGSFHARTTTHGALDAPVSRNPSGRTARRSPRSWRVETRLEGVDRRRSPSVGHRGDQRRESAGSSCVASTAAPRARQLAPPRLRASADGEGHQAVHHREGVGGARARPRQASRHDLDQREDRERVDGPRRQDGQARLGGASSHARAAYMNAATASAHASGSGPGSVNARRRRLDDRVKQCGLGREVVVNGHRVRAELRCRARACVNSSRPSLSRSASAVATMWSRLSEAGGPLGDGCLPWSPHVVPTLVSVGRNSSAATTMHARDEHAP